MAETLRLAGLRHCGLIEHLVAGGESLAAGNMKYVVSA